MDKLLTSRSEEYKQFIREQVCLICWSNNPDPHHETTEGKGTGVKCSDYLCLPLCREHHSMRDNMGKKTFWQKFGIDFKAEITRLNKEFSEIQELKKVTA